METIHHTQLKQSDLHHLKVVSLNTMVSNLDRCVTHVCESSLSFKTYQWTCEFFRVTVILPDPLYLASMEPPAYTLSIPDSFASNSSNEDQHLFSDGAGE